jgi:glycine cleavage system transcriptional repressor
MGNNTRKKLIAVSVLGKDRPGIVASITRVFFDNGCNIEDSSMTQLLNEFAMILLVAVPSEKSLPGLRSELAGVSFKLGLSLSIRPLRSEELVRSKFEGKPFIISVYGADRAGIVYRISSLLAKKRVNITDLKTRIVKTKARPLYIMIIEIDLPRSKTMVLKSGLKNISKALNINIDLHPAETPQL